MQYIGSRKEFGRQGQNRLGVGGQNLRGFESIGGMEARSEIKTVRALEKANC